MRQRSGGDRGRCGTAGAAGFLLAWAVILFALAAAVYGIAGNGELLAEEMLRHAPPKDTALPEAEYAGVGRMTAGYLTGREESFQYTFRNAAGDIFLCFQPHEADHMADCRELIALSGRLRWILGGTALMLIGTGILLRRERRAFTTGLLAGLTSAAGIGALILGWALVDFAGLFTAFHRLAFTNDGWLLDPRTDLLIRLMPTEFFTALGLRVLAWTAAASGVLGMTGWFLKHELR